MPNDAFGIPEVPVETDPELPWLQEPVAEETPAETPPDGTQPEPEPAPEVAPQEAPPAEEPPAETPSEEAAKLWANKYKDPEGLERGYRELRDLQRRTAERANATEARLSELETQARQYEDALRRAVPLIQQAQAAQLRQAQQAPAQGFWPQAEEGAPTTPQYSPEQIQLLVDQMVAERVGQAQQELTTRADAQESIRAAEATIMGFYQKHPEVEPQGEIDADITAAIQDLNEAWDQRDASSLDISDPDSLEIAYEVMKRPALLEILKLHPDYVDTDAGMELARFQASILEGNAITQQTAAVPASQVGQTVGQRKPVIESASQKAPAGSPDDQLDEFDKAVLEYQRARKSGLAGSVFG